MLPGQVFAAPPGLHGIDTNTVLDDRHCRAARAHGFTFCLRYVSRGERQQANDLHEAEARTILNAGTCFDARSTRRPCRLVADKELMERLRAERRLACS